MNILEESVQHFLAGVTVSGLDYVSSKWALSKQERVSRKKETLDSMLFVLDNAAKQEASETPEYATHVELVKAYLSKEGYAKQTSDKSGTLFNRLYQKMVNVPSTLKSAWQDEKINNLTLAQKAILTLGLEVGYDTILFGTSYYSKMGESPIASFANNLWQMPSFLLGLVVGKPVFHAFDYLTLSKEEKTINKGLKDTIHNTDLIKIAMEYHPSEQVRESLLQGGVEFYAQELTRRGKGFYEGARKLGGQVVGGAQGAIDGVRNYSQSRREADAKEAQKRRDRFDQITKNH